MHFYPFNIGDYRKDTGRLNFIEHGIYRMLIDEYYLSEHPLNPDKERLKRTLGIRTKEEVEAFDFIIDEFFTLSESGFSHYGCDKVLNKIYEKSESARKSAKVMWEKKREKEANALKSEANALADDANALKSDAQSMLPITHYPLPKDIEEKPEAKAPQVNKISPEDIQELYNQICTDLPQCQNLSDKRIKRLNAQFKKSVTVKGTKYKCSDIEFWEKYFHLIHSIDWINGRCGKSYNVDFEYVIREENIIKNCEAIK